MSAEHTPGPWAIHKSFPEYIVPAGHAHRACGASIYDARNLTYYAQVIVRVDQDSYGRGDRDATARLIAAAPDVLAALQMVPLSTEWSCMEADTQDAVLAAIAKATAAADPEPAAPAQSEGV